MSSQTSTVRLVDYALRRFLVGATHCVALVQQGRMWRQGEAVTRPYRQALHAKQGEAVPRPYASIGAQLTATDPEAHAA